MSEKYFSVSEIKIKMANYCAYQERCQYEVEQKLEEFILLPEIKDELFIYLIQENFVNEERYAKHFAYSKFNQKKWGKIKIKQHLKQKRIPIKLIETALKEIDSDSYYVILKKLIEQKSKNIKESNHYKKNAKIVRYVQQKGFESSLIFEIINELKMK